MQEKQKILFVCTGNICRSPTADAVMRHLIAKDGLAMMCDSAGIHSYHAGEAPDSRSQAAGGNRGYDFSSIRSRKVQPDDYKRFDYILAMDESHLRWLEKYRPPDATATLEMFIDSDVPDPYYGGEQGFELVLDIVEAGVDRWVQRLS